MKKFEANCLEEVYELATLEFKCSITDLQIEIIQQPSKGFLGFGKKTAIIEVCYKEDCKTYEKDISSNKYKAKDIKIEDVSSRIKDSDAKDKQQDEANKKEDETEKLNKPKLEPKERIFDNFYNEKDCNTQVSNVIIKKDYEQIIDEIKQGIDLLFANSCYDIDEIKVEMYDDETIYIEFNGDDSALLIGKEGYRYKALSYILFNWINEKYGLMLRLEVAKFLKNQEEATHAYLEPVIETIKEKGMFKTKPLDGILVHIALKRLRDEFPNKYVAVKTNVRGDKYVLVNEYRSKEY
ncbi:MAG: Jag N-terminal domain-containing protein [Campylobacterota bacterium]